MTTREDKVFEHDEALVKRERTIRFTRTAATCLAALMFFSVILRVILASKHDVVGAMCSTFLITIVDRIKIPVFDIFVFCIFAAIANEYNLMCKHIDSIKLYRMRLNEQTETKTSQQNTATLPRVPLGGRLQSSGERKRE